MTTIKAVTVPAQRTSTVDTEAQAVIAHAPWCDVEDHETAPLISPCSSVPSQVEVASGSASGWVEATGAVVEIRVDGRMSTADLRQLAAWLTGLAGTIEN